MTITWTGLRFSCRRSNALHSPTKRERFLTVQVIRWSLSTGTQLDILAIKTWMCSLKF
uniref:Uncharacterized protein n=1 Tax=Arundo donax TaxID=35708 RepID=A0A0A9EB89_ARUDO